MHRCILYLGFRAFLPSASSVLARSYSSFARLPHPVSPCTVQQNDTLTTCPSVNGPTEIERRLLSYSDAIADRRNFTKGKRVSRYTGAAKTNPTRAEDNEKKIMISSPHLSRTLCGDAPFHRKSRTRPTCSGVPISRSSPAIMLCSNLSLERNERGEISSQQRGDERNRFGEIYSLSAPTTHGDDGTELVGVGGVGRLSAAAYLTCFVEHVF